MPENEFWIGDKVRITTSGKEGLFEGTSEDGRARIKWNNKILLTPIRNLQGIQDVKRIKKIDIEPLESRNRKRYHDYNPTIDLHIDVLNPGIANEAPQIILSHQILRCKEHMAQALSLNIKTINVIHGKGTGQLKREVDHLIAMNDAVRFSVPQNDGGATEIWLR